MTDSSSTDQALAVLRRNLSLDRAPASFPRLSRALGESPDPRAFEALLDGIARGGDYIRAECATGLGYTGRREAIPALVDAYRHDPGIYVRCDAILALGRLGAADLVPEWLSKFSEESFEVQKRIVLAIHLMERAVAEPALRSLRMELAAGATVLREMIDERLRTLR